MLFKKLCLTLMALALFSISAHAGAVKIFNKDYTGNVAAVELPTYMFTTYLYEVKLVASADDAITVTFTDEDGDTIWAGTSASATSTEYLDPADGGAYRVLTPGSKIAVSDFAGGGTLTLTVISVD